MFGLGYLKKLRRRIRAKKRTEPLLADPKSPAESDDQAPPPQKTRAEPRLPRSQPVGRKLDLLPPDHPSFWRPRGHFLISI